MSDHYWLRAANDIVIEVFCDMTRTCGGVTGGWMRVAQLDTTTNPYQCPHPLIRNTQHGKSLCARRETAGGCSEVHYQTHSIAYNEVCGRVIGYQFGSVDGPYSGTTVGTNINGPYIDGISFTHSSPRQHIWLFIVALDEAGHIQQSTCDCTNRNFCGFSASSFVVTDYLCDTESKESFVYPFILYLTIQYGMVLGVAQDSECCTFQPPPPPPVVLQEAKSKH